MSVFRVQKTKNYTVMSNHHLKNTNLSLKAKGLLSLMLSLPENWDYSMKGLCSICLEQEKSIKSTLDELKRHGYLTVDKVRNSQGRYEYIYTIFEEPSDVTPDENTPPHHNGGVVKKPDPHYPQVDEPGVDDPAVEKDGQLNTNILNTKELNTNKSNTIPSFIHSTDVIDSEVTSNKNSEGMKVYKKICDNVNFKMLIHNNPDKIKFIVFIQSVISSVVKGDKPIKSKGQIIQKNKCIDMYLKLNGEMIIGIIDDLINCRSKIKDYFAYIASALYLAPMQDDIKREKPKNQSSFDIDEYEKFADTLDLRKGIHDQWLMDNGLGDLVINTDDKDN